MGLALLFIIIFCYHWVEESTDKQLFYNPEEVPHHKVGVLLGTSRYKANGGENLYFLYRINAAISLFKSKKIDYILVSGDNRTMNYNEPLMMQNALIEKGIPKNKIVLDYAGLRTLDSVIRAKEIFGQASFVIISQKFHLERALFIAKESGIEALGFTAQDVPDKYSIKTKIREYLARVKMVLDLFITDTDPKHLGKPVSI